ncbi:MAG: hypothetical protein A2233_05450 [Candidatus Kerfeldbacteria bacterium RIFOXYA2_FULL_38_24]|uniref:Uncharacterized protein n=1 Tax=Candidatus Kerfeldbacteria bacterium RIFOXYB2_FULL_38_14 TaxID=1798547 RepID=A0A1G2BGD1_9BACT|nr:MAG: hypothetical protein A2233_05450 [Candidatus Kerfeldbacteria bacterium RIFOXYA2_FULL_38_24]OGY88273.1 MAG: hypothetical protein A2319_03740 [Candidatus Kerfeldbacteria bacterium RIFOXYB2_FULL_38_14]
MAVSILSEDAPKEDRSFKRGAKELWLSLRYKVKHPEKLLQLKDYLQATVDGASDRVIANLDSLCALSADPIKTVQALTGVGILVDKLTFSHTQILERYSSIFKSAAGKELMLFELGSKVQWKGVPFFLDSDDERTRKIVEVLQNADGLAYLNDESNKKVFFDFCKKLSTPPSLEQLPALMRAVSDVRFSAIAQTIGLDSTNPRDLGFVYNLNEEKTGESVQKLLAMHDAGVDIPAGLKDNLQEGIELVYSQLPNVPRAEDIFRGWMAKVEESGGEFFEKEGTRNFVQQARPLLARDIYLGELADVHLLARKEKLHIAILSFLNSIDPALASADGIFTALDCTGANYEKVDFDKIFSKELTPELADFIGFLKRDLGVDIDAYTVIHDLLSQDSLILKIYHQFKTTRKIAETKKLITFFPTESRAIRNHPVNNSLVYNIVDFAEIADISGVADVLHLLKTKGFFPDHLSVSETKKACEELRRLSEPEKQVYLQDDKIFSSSPFFQQVSQVFTRGGLTSFGDQLEIIQKAVEIIHTKRDAKVNPEQITIIEEMRKKTHFATLGIEIFDITDADFVLLDEYKERFGIDRYIKVDEFLFYTKNRNQVLEGIARIKESNLSEHSSKNIFSGRSVKPLAKIGTATNWHSVADQFTALPRLQDYYSQVDLDIKNLGTMIDDVQGYKEYLDFFIQHGLLRDMVGSEDMSIVSDLFPYRETVRWTVSTLVDLGVGFAYPWVGIGSIRGIRFDDFSKMPENKRLDVLKRSGIIENGPFNVDIINNLMLAYDDLSVAMSVVREVMGEDWTAPNDMKDLARLSEPGGKDIVQAIIDLHDLYGVDKSLSYIPKAQDLLESGAMRILSVVVNYGYRFSYDDTRSIIEFAKVNHDDRYLAMFIYAHDFFDLSFKEALREKDRLPLLVTSEDIHTAIGIVKKSGVTLNQMGKVNLNNFASWQLAGEHPKTLQMIIKLVPHLSQYFDCPIEIARLLIPYEDNINFFGLVERLVKERQYKFAQNLEILNFLSSDNGLEIIREMEKQSTGLASIVEDPRRLSLIYWFSDNVVLVKEVENYFLKKYGKRSWQLGVANSMGYMINNQRYETLQMKGVTIERGGDQIEASVYIEEFVGKYFKGGKGKTIVVLLSAQEYLPGQSSTETLKRIVESMVEYEPILDKLHSDSVPEGLGSSLGMEYEIIKGTAEGYKEKFDSELKGDIRDLSMYAGIPSGFDAVHEIASSPTDNPYCLLLEMKLLQDLGFVDFNFNGEGYAKGARGYHLTIGGERGLIADDQTHFLQNCLLITGWGGVNAGKKIDKLEYGRGLPLRERGTTQTVKMFSNASSAVEMRVLSVDKWEQLERVLTSSFFGAMAIQATQKYFSEVAIEQFLLRDDKMFPDSPAGLNEYVDQSAEFPDQKTMAIIYEWFRLRYRVKQAVVEHNNYFLENELGGYTNESGRWIDAEDFGGENNDSRFKSVVANIGQGLSLEEYLQDTKIDPEKLTASADASLVNALTATSNLFLKPSKETSGDRANALAMLGTTKLQNMELESGDVQEAEKSVFDKRGSQRKGYYYLQGGSERMIIHAVQIALLDFNKNMEKIISFDKKEDKIIHSLAA